jgi:hypothetical protein
MWMRYGPIANSVPLGAPWTDWVRLCTCPIYRRRSRVTQAIVRLPTFIGGRFSFLIRLRCWAVIEYG